MYHTYKEFINEGRMLEAESWEELRLIENYLGEKKSSKKVDFKEKHGIMQVKSGVGFSEKEQKWYGWSHRAYYGFGIGSKIKPGDIGFQASSKEEFIEDFKNIWFDKEYHDKKTLEIKEFKNKVIMTVNYNDKVPNKDLRGTIDKYEAIFPKKWGKGEWTAKTLEDAKEMAEIFSENIS